MTGAKINQIQGWSRDLAVTTLTAAERGFAVVPKNVGASNPTEFVIQVFLSREAALTNAERLTTIPGAIATLCTAQALTVGDVRLDGVARTVGTGFIYNLRFAITEA